MILGCTLPNIEATFETHPKKFQAPMQAAEIKLRLDNMKRTTASRLDEIRKQIVSKKPVMEGLAFLFNALLLAGMVIKLSPRQKGFISEAGCFNNVLLLKEALRAMTHTKKAVVIQLNITKAFDTIPHDLIATALSQS
ncbi:Hypothetical predicted protein [Cloeon dipterum]|uniref:Reverse transcriptase domain-containing protein n=1 Tax=Cloeon dipterum TaxID=197152 RepID=A0A8S1D222_9INSE|nr:Hypothetical predicted protein [Cloeon dipterum]